MHPVKPALIALAAVGILCGCAHNRPPERVVKAIHTVNRYAPEYVVEANMALEKTKHPDAERLCGVGQRVADALDALDRWAGQQETVDERR